MDKKMIYFAEIDKKWQKAWEEKKIFESNPINKEKFYLTAAYPYPNSPQHIGHARTYTIADVVARFQRMQRKNVLFPMAFHVTGTPIFGMAKRIEKNDKEMIEIFEKIYNIEKEKISQFTDPKKLVYYFSSEIESGMKKIGYSIDWRRKFFTFDKHYNKFIEWQFKKLHQLGLLEKGHHPVPWCPAENQAIGAHDTRGDIEPKIEEVIIIFFYEPQEDIYFPTATYRPDTLVAVTNIWINPSYEHVIVEWNKKKFILSKKAAQLLKEQIDIKIIGTTDVTKYLDKYVLNPLTKEKVPILPAKFVKEEVGTGIVMSVPAHAPFDYVALKNLDQAIKEKIKIISALKTQEYGDKPAVRLVEEYGIVDENDPKLEEITKEIYSKEAHEGIMVFRGFENLSASEGKEKIKQILLEQNNGILIYTLANAPIYSRAGNPCTVKIVKDQWFINYSKKDWKKKALIALSEMKIIPEKLRKEFEYTIEWLDKKACTRKKGFGTIFPFDKSQVIEALSDSTIYMAYYTISHITKELNPEELSEEFFDYVFLSKDSKEKKEFWDKCREEFHYWYPLDSRHSAIDLVHNHLTFFIFNHVAILDKKNWPKQIVANALVTMDGKKMSKSFGNILPLSKALENYGADLIRFSVTATAEIDMDSDFSLAVVEGAKQRLMFYYNILEKFKDQKPEKKVMDQATKIFYSKFHKKVKECKEHYANLELKSIAQKIFYEEVDDINQYLNDSDSPYLREFLEYWALIICPIMPHTAEEFWHQLGQKYHLKDSDFASLAFYPEHDETQIDEELEKQEDYIKAVIKDSQEIKKLAKIEPKKIIFIIAGKYKYDIVEIIKEKKEEKEVLREIMQKKEFEKYKKNLFEITKKMLKNIGKYVGYGLSAQKEKEYLEKMKNKIQKQLSCQYVEILEEENAPEEFARKAILALPAKPAIIFI
ncbi:MAG: leucine--tRNA ligase [Candidatus Anstonellaceae archaeon]